MMDMSLLLRGSKPPLDAPLVFCFLFVLLGGYVFFFIFFRA